MPTSIVSVDQQAIKSELALLVRKTVEETISGLLEEQANELVEAERYERTDGHDAYRAGYYKRGLLTASGEISLSIPKLKGAKFTTAIIERYKRRKESVKEAMIEMYLAGVSTRRIEDVSEILWESVIFVKYSFHKVLDEYNILGHSPENRTRNQDQMVELIEAKLPNLSESFTSSRRGRATPPLRL